VVSVLRDITRSDQVLSRAKAEAEAANESKSRFLAQMSHEIRTPLNAVLGTNGLLLASPLSPEQRQLCELMRSSGQVLLALINDILDLSKIEAGHMTLEIVRFDPLTTVQDVVSLLSVRAQARGLGLQLLAAAGVSRSLMGDPSRLRQVLFNLVGNALKFTERGEVLVKLGQQPLADGRVQLQIEVSDTGIGIPAELMPRLFDRFVQGDNSTARRYGGSGLGLAISHDLVALMGGDIRVRSQLGSGSTFTVCLPLALADLAAAPEAGTPTALEAAPQRRILVAEDNGVNQILIKAMLDRLGHYCDIVADGLEAVRQVQAAHYDLVLMDLQMPGMDGETATREIRLLPGALAHIPIVAMTAHAMPGDRQAMLDAGMTDQLTKPVDLAVLAATITRVTA
jgi:CheY-like chemotaxis protein